jgi:small-conductance mechanosensitive channel/CRP-like cAMP-binding protein
VSQLTLAYRETLLVLGAPAVYVLLVLVGRWLKRRHGVKLGLLYHLFAAVLAAYLCGEILAIPWGFIRHLGAAAALLFSGVLVLLINRFIWELYFGRVRGVNIPRFLVEFVGLLVVTTTAFLVLVVGYDQTLKGLLIAPGIAAVILGLAMQDLLGNIIAGVALQLGKSYVEGEWLLIDGRYAQVREINWRSTRLVTNDDFSIEVPNRAIAQQTIINLNRPTRQHAMRLSVAVDYTAPPTRVKNILVHAAGNAVGVLPEPKPKAYIKTFAESGVEYELKFWIEDFATFFDVCDAIRTNIWYSFRRHGIRIPYPTRTLLVQRSVREKNQELQTEAREILRKQRFFERLTDEQLDALLPRGRLEHFGRGEKLIVQGDQGESMFVLVEGEVDVLVNHNGTSTQVETLRSGDCFGEMSLLTGEARRATVLARTDCEVIEIGKEVLGKSLKENPDLLTHLSQLLAHRQVENESRLNRETGSAVGADNQARYAASFMQKLRHFFEL